MGGKGNAIRCQICDGAETEAAFEACDYLTGRAFEVRKCRACGVGFTWPQPDDIDSYYPMLYRRFTPMVTAVLRTLYWWRVRRWVRSLRPGRALELGCGSGWMLRALADRGWRVVGIERNAREASVAATALHLPIFAGNFDALRLGSRFDLIILFQVLEHMLNPVATLLQCVRLLAPGGRLIVTVPNFASWQARFSKRHWLHLDVPRHLFHFSPSSLTLALARAGLTVDLIRFVSFEHDPYGWVQSVLNLSGIEQNLLTKWLMGIERRHAVSLSGAMMALGGVLLVPPALVLAAASWLARRGAIVEVCAVAGASRGSGR